MTDTIGGFVPLHAHDCYSVLDGISKPSGLARRCKELGISACAITNHGCISSADEHIEACKKHNVKPILGIEAYISGEANLAEKRDRNLTHFILLAKNFHGWKQLVKLVSESNKPEHFYYKPRLNIDLLTKFLDGNLVGFSGHPGSYLFNEFFLPNTTTDAFRATSEEEVKKYIRPDWVEHVSSIVLDLQQKFGKDNFYLEIQLIDAANMPAAALIAKGLRYISRKTSIPCVATDDSHYVLREDAVDQRVVLCTNMNTTLREIHQKIINEEDVGLGNFFKYDHYYLHSYDEMRALGHTEEELANTLKVASMCEHYNIKQKPKLPRFSVPSNTTPEEYLKDLCRKGWATLRPKLKKAMERKGVSQQVYVDRFNEEFNVLMDEGLADYFLIVEDVIRFARSRGQLTGVARGSSGGSLILYLLGVTKIDPIYYDLLFARFFNSARNVPDHVSFEESPFLKFIGV